jgi:hypothetical protein
MLCRPVQERRPGTKGVDDELTTLVHAWPTDPRLNITTPLRASCPNHIELTPRFVLQVVMNLCSEPLRATLADSLGLGGFAGAAAYQGSRNAAQALLDEVDERALYARYGL